MPNPNLSRRQNRRNNRKWEVQGGVAQLHTPGMNGATITPTHSKRLDKEIEKLTTEQTRFTAQVAAIQEELVEIGEELTELTDLRATVTKEP